MNKIQRFTIAWAAKRVIYLDKVKRYEDSYAVSQEFCEWINCISIYPELLDAATLKVPNFNKENRTS
tara:strand:- start:1201 stop:1401 length:201 start_codon:yes stop_codon:yes gene_type:complete